MEQNFKGKNVFITGAASGIGRASAELFYKKGASLTLMDLPSLQESELSNQFPENMTYIQGNICHKETLEKIQSHMNTKIDVLINNAGITQDAQAYKMSDEQWQSVIDVNLTAVFKISRMAAQVMREKKSGNIINAASVVAHNGNFGQANYSATKAGVIALTKSMAKELGKYNVRVNAIAPGFVQTAMVSKMPEKVIQMMCEKTPLKRLASTTDIANAYCFLASEQAAYITGTCLNIDGGIVL